MFGDFLILIACYCWEYSYVIDLSCRNFQSSGAPSDLDTAAHAPVTNNTRKRGLLDLPPEVLVQIFQYFPFQQVYGQFTLVCQQMRAVIADNKLDFIKMHISNPTVQVLTNLVDRVNTCQHLTVSLGEIPHSGDETRKPNLDFKEPVEKLFKKLGPCLISLTFDSLPQVGEYSISRPRILSPDDDVLELELLQRWIMRVFDDATKLRSFHTFDCEYLFV